ncbi:nickel pincer cofactor biosynthesis protein LarC [Prochlorococcus sp. MIT 1223]|uniref:nickel pincer cofactor biosynthesis protein LarC n=1 Tax=Prochlorococcus sp. MIT 1223 TaxID=3096217 RepID=UPI002A764002|nr:nickel pincer cofactor biosynthesis protein LarC [Prochlorococcus sp. MIT 1223]
MKNLYLECPIGISGDMFLAALIDLGFPENLLKDEVKKIGLNKSFKLEVIESKSYGLRGKKIDIEKIKTLPSIKSWLTIEKEINSLRIKDSVKVNILNVFKEIALAESVVHGCELSDVHFHELASIETLVNIFGVCLAIDFFKPKNIYCTPPVVGSGNIKTAHGVMPVPVPCVMEIAKRNNIQLSGGSDSPESELTTPTGIALLSVFVDEFKQPSSIKISSIGIGLGKKDFCRPNFLRLSQIDNVNLGKQDKLIPKLSWEILIVQEAWIDDSSPEDLADLITKLRKGGALDVISYPVQMKKGRQGMNIQAILYSNLAEELRMIWFSQGTTIGLRETEIGRWVLPRRKGVCFTRFGEIKVKQVKRPNGELTIKPEHNDLLKISKETDKSPDQIRKEMFQSLENFVPSEDWSFE